MLRQRRQRLTQSSLSSSGTMKNMESTRSQDQVARACKRERSFGLQKAYETDDVGRSVITYSQDLKDLLEKARIIENIKITVTIRSARDTFREQMCGTIIEWLLDISGCSVGSDHDILKQTVCQEMLKPWRTGSNATNAAIGRDGIDDHEIEEAESESEMLRGRIVPEITATTRPDGGVAIAIVQAAVQDDDDTDDATERDDEANSQTQDGDGDDLMEMDIDVGSSDTDLDMRSTADPPDELEAEEATLAGYPPPPPPPPAASNPQRTPTLQRPFGSRQHRRSASSSVIPDPTIPLDPAESTPKAAPLMQVPMTPYSHARTTSSQPPPAYWLERPHSEQHDVPPAEDIRQRVRLDQMILFDLRLWKKARVDLRDLYISTVVNVPDFKRVLGLRFAGLYTVLAQLYLIADREPDHSIIYLSLQMLTTPSITQEIIEKGNFLTNLIAILYTFLTARQVGHPYDVSTTATLAFDAGSVTNRRMYHFFMDMKHLFLSPYVQARMREDERYVLQFLDLIKLPQGICPNVRAVGEHVEYETDAWISASILTRELNRLCRQFAEAFKWKTGEDDTAMSRTIRTFAMHTIINSVGAERRRFQSSELKSEVQFKDMSWSDFEIHPQTASKNAAVVSFVVEKDSISFHHALHYTLSWLVDGAKSMSPDQLRHLLSFDLEQLQQALLSPSLKECIPRLDPETYLIAMFDFPLRVCAWLAQMKAGMWVRNGLSLRHQMSTYRGVAPRDLAYRQDIFLLQTAMAVCDPERVLLSMIDRFGMEDWMRGQYVVRTGWEESQLLDVAEDFIHLLIVLLSERTSLHAVEDEPMPQALAIRRDITHILCFKPLSFSELTSRLADKQELDEFQDILEEMTTFKPPEGLSDTGTFELKPQFLSELDPYIAHYTKNQRDEAETIYRTWVSKRTGKPLEQVVLEPNLRPIHSGLFKDISAFTKAPLFSQILWHSLNWALSARDHSQNIPATRIEAFLLVVLHLLLIGVLEDRHEDQYQDLSSSFVHRMLSGFNVYSQPREQKIIFLALQSLLSRDDLAACHPKAKLVLHRARQRQPFAYSKVTTAHGIQLDRMGTDSPSNIQAEDLEAKKKQALERQAKVMAQFQKQQQDFMSNQSTIDWGEDFEDSDEEAMQQEETSRVWKYPSGNCILCQEETNDSRLYGTFALIIESNILRQTDFEDEDYVREVVELPDSLDRSADAIRPFGVGGRNRVQVRKFTSDGFEVMSERQGLGKGFNAKNCRSGPVSVGCGHIMHYNCFELYCQATQRRQTHQIARNHPEQVSRMEFVCPLCKALGNTFLPIIWKPKEESFPGVLQTESTFTEWLEVQIGLAASRYHKHPANQRMTRQKEQDLFARNVLNTMITPSAISIINRMSTDPGPTSPLRSSIANMPGIFPEDNPSSQPSVSETFALEELMTIYARIRETIKTNALPSRFTSTEPTSSPETLSNTDVLATALGYSISAAEIAHRGVESEPNQPLLERIPASTLTHLRVLSETAASYIAVGGLRSGGKNRPTEEFFHLHSRQLLQILGGHPQIYGGENPADNELLGSQSKIPAALAQDPFVLLSEASIFVVPALQIDIHHMAQLCYFMEIVKVIMNAQHCHRKVAWSFEVPGSKQNVDAETFQEFQNFVAYFEGANGLHTTLSEDIGLLHKVCHMVAAYSLAYLRKVMILLHVSYGVKFPSTGYGDYDEPELARVTRALRFPTLAEMFRLGYTKSSPHSNENTALQWVMSAWVNHFKLMCEQGPQLFDKAILGLRVAHPCIFRAHRAPQVLRYAT